MPRVRNIEREMREIAARAKPADVFVLYLAGHGVSIEGNYYFIPSQTFATQTRKHCVHRASTRIP